MLYRPLRAVENEETPEDAEVVGETWRFMKADGTPDTRRTSNPRYDVVSYGLLTLTGTEPVIRLLVSNKAAVRFARAFGAGGTKSGHEKRRRLQPAKNGPAGCRRQRSRRPTRSSALGLEPGASSQEIHAAYAELKQRHR